VAANLTYDDESRRTPLASEAAFVQFVIDQIDGAGEIASRKMFGEYALYCNKKVVALICDNRLFVKPTEGGRKHIRDVVEAPAFPGAKPSFLIEEKLEDRKWLAELIRITEKELPDPKPGKKSTKSAPVTKKARRR
jgi:TfoX/Sxy family transcriptional regulator of competence genes